MTGISYKEKLSNRKSIAKFPAVLLDIILEPGLFFYSDFHGEQSVSWAAVRQSSSKGTA